MSRRLATLSGVAWSLMSQATRMALQLASTIILARLLTPSDFGVFAMLLPIVALAGLLQEFGLSQAILRDESVTSEQVNGLFWLNLSVAFIISMALFLMSPLLAAFFNEPRLEPLIAAYGGVTLLGSLGFGQYALFARAFRFQTIAIIDIASALFAFISAILVAYVAPSPWALWIGSLASVATWTLLSLMSSDWRPSRSFDAAGISKLYGFGAFVMLDHLSHVIRTNLDTVLIGRYLGAVPLGQYDRAYKLLLYPLENVGGPVGRVMLPVFSRLQAEPESLRKAFLQSAGLFCFICMPGTTVLLATSHEIIGILLGPKWIGVSDIFVWLGVGGLFAPYLVATSWLFLAQGRARQLMNVNMANTAIAAAGFFVGLAYGVVGIAIVYAMTEILFRTPVTLWASGQSGPIRVRDHVSLLGPNLLACVSVFETIRLVLNPHLTGASLIAVSILLAYLETALILSLFAEGRRTLTAASTLVQDALRIARRKRVRE